MGGATRLCASARPAAFGGLALLAALVLAVGCTAPLPGEPEPDHRSTLPSMGIGYQWPAGFGTESRRGARGRHRAHLRPDDPSLILGVLQFQDQGMPPERRVTSFVADVAQGGETEALERRTINGLPFLLQRSRSPRGEVQVGLTRRNGLNLLGYSILTRTGETRRDAENARLADAFFTSFQPVEPK